MRDDHFEILEKFLHGMYLARHDIPLYPWIVYLAGASGQMTLHGLDHLQGRAIPGVRRRRPPCRSGHKCPPLRRYLIPRSSMMSWARSSTKSGMESLIFRAAKMMLARPG